MNMIVSVLELSLQHRNEDLAQLKQIISIRNSEINTLTGVVFVVVLKVRDDVKKVNKDPKMVMESLKWKRIVSTHPATTEAANSKSTVTDFFRFTVNL